MAALLDLLVYALFFFAFALALLGKKVAAALLGGIVSALQHIPLIGDKLAGPVEAVNQAVADAMGSVVNGIEKAIGKSWHLQARLLDWVGRELKTHGQALLSLAVPVAGLLATYRAVRSLIHDVTHTTHGISGRVKTVEREYHGIEADVRSLDHRLTRGIGDDVLPRLKSLDKEVATLRHDTIPALREAEGEASKAISDLWAWVKQNTLVAGTAAFAGAVAVALTSLGLGWLRCDSNPFKNNNAACGLWNDLSSLFGLLADLFLFANFCDLWSEATPFIGILLDPVVGIIASFADGACSHRPSSWQQIGSPLNLPTSAEITATLPEH